MSVDEDPVIKKLIAWAEGKPSVRAMLLTSNRAVPDTVPDAFSDYDVIIVATDINEFLDDSWLGDFGRVLTVYRDPVRMESGFERFTRVTQYEDGLKIDFSVCPVGWLQYVAEQPILPEELDVGYRALLDKDNLAEDLKPPTYTAFIPTPPTPKEYHEAIENFFSNSAYVAKQICRGDLMATIATLDDRMKLHRIRQMLDWKIAIDTGWVLPSGAYGKGLKKRLDPETWAALEATWTGAGKTARWEALFRTIDLYRRVAKEVGASLGFTYPQDMDDRVAAYLRRIKARDETQ
ncbi:MAG: aminoglycoside 6-adenylyltransferase [Dehalococcoidales bacterium]|nr:aminoglycoside 6-adenylyltransferase [Dehalococcoidales bacterium]